MKNLNWKQKTALFLTSQAITMFGSSLVQYAIIWYVALQTQSGIMMTLITVCGFLPQVLISVFAGVWADRYSRKMLIITADASIALFTLLLALLVYQSDNFFWALIAISILRSAGAGVQGPAVNAMIPQLVPQDNLMRVSGINGSVMSIVNLVAPAVAGGMLAWSAFSNILLIDVVTAVIGISIFLCVPVGKHAKALQAQKGGYLDDLKTGLRYSWQTPFIRRLLGVCMLFCFLTVPASLLNVLFVTREFGDSYLYLTLNEVFFFVGALLGGLLLGAWGGFKNRLKTMGIGGLAFGTLTIALGIADIFWVYLVFIFLVGVAMPFNNTPLFVLVQEKVIPDMQGRVFSLVQIVTSLIMPVGMAIFGPLADVISLRLMMVCSGVSLLIMTMCIFFWKSFYHEGITHSLDAPTQGDSAKPEDQPAQPQP